MRSYGFSPENDTVEPAQHFPKYFIYRYFGDALHVSKKRAESWCHLRGGTKNVYIARPRASAHNKEMINNVPFGSDSYDCHAKTFAVVVTLRFVL